MRKLNLTFIVIFISFVVFSQDWIEFIPSETTSPTYNLLSSTDSIVEFEMIVPGMFTTEVDSFQRVNIPEHVKFDSTGCPEIPVVSFLVAVPECDSIALNITTINSERISDMYIYPAPAWVEDTTAEGYTYLKEEFRYNDTVYSTNHFFNGTIAELTDRGAIRDQHVVRVLLYPVQFNPVTKEVIAYSEVKISLSFENPAGSIHQDVGIFNEMLGNTLINYESNGLNASVSCGSGTGTLNCEDYWVTSLPNQKIDEPCDYLIITHQNFFENTYLCDFADHRTSYNGFDIKIVTTSVIGSDILPQGLPLEDKIKLLIKNTYNSNNANNTYDGKLAYVNLFGDVLMEGSPPLPGIPTFYDPLYPELGGYDVVYTQLTIPPDQNEPDIYPDLMIGRCSVDDETQLQNVVTKITTFTPFLYTYNNKILNFLGLAEDYTSQSEVIEEMDLIIENSYNNELIYPEEYNGYIPENWDLTSYTANPGSDVVAGYSEGQIFFNYMGHGSSIGICDFSYDDIYSTPEGIFPFFISGACVTGKFQGEDDCLGERFLCYEHNRGAIGFIGASNSVNGNTFHILSNYYESTLHNYSLMLGEAFMETKFQYYNSYYHYINNYNLFGDPALNIFYENSAPLPDLYIKNYHITFSPFPTNLGETIYINAHIRNNTGIAVDSPFSVNCYAVNTDSQEIIQIGENEVSGVPGNYVNVTFTWNTSGLLLNDNDFDIYIEIDIYDQIIEIIEYNNINSNNLKLYLYASDFPVSVEKTNNSNPVCFNFYPEYDGDEIVFGENVFTYKGDEILVGENSTNGNTAVSNLYNNDKFQYLTIKTDEAPIEIEAFEPPSSEPIWLYQISQNSSDWVGPIISDLDHDGFEEVIILEIVSDGTKLICLNHDGTFRWDYDFSNQNDKFFIVCNLNNTHNHIVFINSQGMMYFLMENEANNKLEIDYTFEIPGCNKYANEFTAADLDKNGNIDFVITYRNESNSSHCLGILDHETMSLNEVIISTDYNYSDPIITDLNNDGLLEIAITNLTSGNLLIYYHYLNLLKTINIADLSLSEIISGDFNGDNNNDLVIMTKKNETDYFLNIYNFSGNQILQTPIIDKLASVRISDINHDNNNEIIYSYGRYLYILDIPYAGSNIGWSGWRCNYRNTGVLEHPAYFAPPDDTVYWMNTISLAGDNIVPHGSTVIIKPGTKIKAHEYSSLIVHGILIAEGTEKHPITFSADINGADAGYWQGIMVPNHSTVSMKHCLIMDAEIGVLFEDNCEVTFENNHIENNLEGVGVQTSRPVLKENIITENTVGIGCYDNAAPVLTDLRNEQQFKNGIINNNTGILIDMSKIYLDNGYNDIYNVPAEGYYIQLLMFEPGPGYIRARQNYWGTTDLEEIYEHLDPAESITIEPVLSSPQSSYVPPGEQEAEMMKSANNAMENGDYTAAENIYKTIIQQYPETTEAYLSISGLFKCTDKSNGNWSDMETYYNELYNDSTYNEDFQKLTLGYINLSKRRQGKFAEAIASYESVILNNPTYNDSVYAVIDIGNTYEEAGNYKSTLGQLSYLVPVSRAKHVEKTVDLLLSLKKENKIHKDQFENNFSITDIFPNPFKKETNIFYTVTYNCNISFKVYDATGRLIHTELIGNTAEGKHQCILRMPDATPGVYHIVFVANGNPATIKKIVVN